MKKIVYSIAFLFIIGLSGCSEKSDVSSLSTNIGKGTGNGVGGSMARFVVADNTLYTVDDKTLKAYDISNPAQPSTAQAITLSESPNIETIFYYNNALFIGSRAGMYIYDATDKLNPVYKTTYEHVYSCDPVVVKNNTAYVTLRAGNNCGRGQSSLDIIDITNLNGPILKESIPMSSPYGLGVSGNTLFVCEGNNGFKAFDVSSPEKPVLVKTITGMFGYDVIPLSNLLILTGNDGLYQYTYSNPNDIQLVSSLIAKP